MTKQKDRFVFSFRDNRFQTRGACDASLTAPLRSERGRAVSEPTHVPNPGCARTSLASEAVKAVAAVLERSKSERTLTAKPGNNLSVWEGGKVAVFMEADAKDSSAIA